MGSDTFGAATDAAAEQLQNFLRSGRLPWSVAADQQTAHDRLLRRVLAAPNASEVLTDVVQDQDMLVRLVRQFNDGMLAQVAAVLHPHRRVARHAGNEAYWLAALRGVLQAEPEPEPEPVSSSPPEDVALAQFRGWRQRNAELPAQLEELHQWLIWWLMHDSSMVNQDCSLMLESIAAQCAEAKDSAQFMRLVLTTLRSGGQLDLEEMAQQSALPATPAAMDAITTLKSQQAIRNFVGQQMVEDARLANLNSAQLHQLVRSWIGEPSSVFLASLESHALQAVSTHAYFQQILQSLLNDQAVDLETLSRPAPPASPAPPAPAMRAASVAPATPATPATMATPAMSAVPTAPTASASSAAPAAPTASPTSAAPTALAASVAGSALAAHDDNRVTASVSAVRGPSPLPALLQQSLPQRLASAILQADLSALEVIWPEITRHHADVLTAASQRYLRRPQERANLIARSSPDMLIAMLKAIAPASGQLIEPILRHAEQCGAVLSPPLSADELRQRIFNLAFQQAIANEDVAPASLIQALLPEHSSPEDIREAGHAWRALLPPTYALDRMLFGDRYRQAIEQHLLDDDDAPPALHQMLAAELCHHYPELVDTPLREQLTAADLDIYLPQLKAIESEDSAVDLVANAPTIQRQPPAQGKAASEAKAKGASASPAHANSNNKKPDAVVGSVGMTDGTTRRSAQEVSAANQVFDHTGAVGVGVGVNSDATVGSDAVGEVMTKVSRPESNAADQPLGHNEIGGATPDADVGNEVVAAAAAEGITPQARAGNKTSAIAGTAVKGEVTETKPVGSLALKTALEAEATLAVLLMRAETLGRTEKLAAELMLQRLLRADGIPLSGALETALSQPSAIERLVELAPAPVLAQLLVQLQPELAAQLPAVLSAIAASVAVASIPAMQSKAHWRIIYQTAFVTADPITPTEFVRNLILNLGGKADTTQPPAQPAAPKRQAAMNALLQPLTRQSAGTPVSAKVHERANERTHQQAYAQTHEQAPEEPIPFTGESNIRNAGMVIIATYAQRLFSIFELTKDGQFINEEAAQRAVHLLQYAITGATTTPEYQLGLNKLLCGIHGGQPIARGIDISDKEKDTIEQMLNGVIAHWKALGKTSIAGLRQTFLQREGHLYFEEEAWHLKIPTSTFDMLLDRLPWSFAMIKFPWMEHPLHVTWR